MARLYGRSPRGTRAPGTARCGSWTRLSVLGALGHEGMLAAMSVEGATSGAVFRAYLERVLLPALRERKPDAVLVMDNLGAHKTPEVRELLDGSGFPYRYLPSYSPDLSPIEPAWAQVKAELRRVAARRVTRTPCTRRSAPPSTASPPPTPGPTSATAATSVPTNSRFALGGAATAPARADRARGRGRRSPRRRRRSPARPSA